MARGTDFGGIHSYRDLNLIQQAVEEQPAEPKLNLIDIPGADGSKDLSELPTGRVVYSDRSLSWTFALYPGENWTAKHRQVSNALNGRRCRITLDEDPGYYYDGRVTVKKYARDKLLRQITVEATCAPYMLKQEKTCVFVPFSGKNIFNPTKTNIIMGSSGCTLSAIDTGVRVAWSSGTYAGKSCSVLPLAMLVGKTVTLSCQAVHTGKAEPRVALGYYHPAKTRLVKADTTKTSVILSLQITEEDAAEFETLYATFYVSGASTSGMAAGDYVDYTNLQIEVSPTATAYEPYTSDTSPREVVLTNECKPVVPTIVCTGSALLTIGGATYTMGAGTHKYPAFQLDKGETAVTLQGEGAAAIIYQEGSL